MVCYKCGRVLQNGEYVCPNCGMSYKQLANEHQDIESIKKAYLQGQNEEQIQQPQKTVNDSGNVGWFFLGFFVPVVGLILWLIWRKKQPKNAKKSIRGALIGCASSLIIILSICAYCTVLSNPFIKI